MIERYSRPEMTKIWSEKRKYWTWLKVELAVCEELAQNRIIPPKDWKELKVKGQKLLDAGGVDPSRVEEHEKVTRHDVIAFTTAVAEKLGPISRYIHFGLTSSDVLDTALALNIQEAGELIQEDVEKLILILRKKANQYKKLPTIGRSHGIFAEPTSFGLKFLGWAVEWERNLSRLNVALEGMKTGKLSGAVGVNAHWSPEFEKKVLKRLDLRREEVSTQVIPRDRHAELMMVLGLMGSSMERIAVEFRHLQRSEVAEVMEGFAKGQKGSSAMPHKRNPISSENLTGCARMLRSYAQASLENVALWHERDISHSSVERVFIPDSFILLDYSLNRMIRLVDGIVVRKEAVQKNLDQAGLTVFSGHILLALVQAGATRENSYYWVQECAIKSLEESSDFMGLISKHEKIGEYLTSAQITKLGSMKHQLRNVDSIFKEAK